MHGRSVVDKPYLNSARCLRAIRVREPRALRGFPLHLPFGPVFMLQIENLVFNGWGRRFFDEATVTLPPGTKVGLVGRNGVGKSTLFKLILGELQPDSWRNRLPEIRAHRFGGSGAPGDAGFADRHRSWRPTSSASPAIVALETRRPEDMGEIYAPPDRDRRRSGARRAPLKFWPASASPTPI